MARVVATGGCFEMLNDGHIELLKACRAIAGKDGKVVVFLNSDESVAKLKGGYHPILPYGTRKDILRAVRYVDDVHCFLEDTPKQAIQWYLTQIQCSPTEFFWVKGAAGYAESGMKETEMVQKYGGRVLYFDNPVKTHTSKIIERIIAGVSCIKD